MKTTGRVGVLFLLVAVITGSGGACRCAQQGNGPNGPSPTPRTLFSRLGGDAGVDAIAAALVGSAQANPAVNPEGAGWSSDAIKNWFADYIRSVSDEPAGAPVRPIHEAIPGMDVTDAGFTALLEDLRAVLRNRSIPKLETDELLAEFEADRTKFVSPAG